MGHFLADFALRQRALLLAPLALVPVLRAPPLFAAAPSAAEGAIEYVAPQGCGSRAEVLTKFAELLGRPAAEIPPIEARIVALPRATHYVLTYEATFQGARAERTLELESCAAVVEAAALLLAISFDPSLKATLDPIEASSPAPRATEGAPAAAPEPAAPAPAAPAAAASATAASTAAPAEPRPQYGQRLSGFVGAALSASSSLTPTVALGGGASLGARIGILTLGIKSLIEATPARAHPSANVDVGGLLWRNRAWAGAVFPLGPLRLGPYLGLGVEVLQVSASGLSSGSSGSGSSPFLSACAGALAFWHLGPHWALELGVGLTVPFERPAFLVNGLPNPVHRPAAVSAEATFGVVWSFGSQ